MRENIVEQLRYCAEHFSCSGCGGDCKTGSNEPRTKAVLNDAADAIEGLLAENKAIKQSNKDAAMRNKLLCDEISRMKEKVPHWISVEERTPTAEDGDPWYRCLAYSDEEQLMTLPLCKVGNGYVTHWMRIEPPPKEDAE